MSSHPVLVVHVYSQKPPMHSWLVPQLLVSVQLGVGRVSTTQAP
jgi:hypothetical protein